MNMDRQSIPQPSASTLVLDQASSPSRPAGDEHGKDSNGG